MIAQWETSTIYNYQLNTLDWKASDIYDAIHRSTPENNLITQKFADEEGNPNGNRIRMKLGKELDDSTLIKQSLIAEPMKFDGTNQYDTGFKLLETDRDWTLLMDVQFLSSDAGTLISCYKNSNFFGFELVNSNQYSSGRLTVSGAQTTSADQNQKTPREVFVVTHKKGETSITVYESALGELTPKKTVLSSYTEDPISDTTLVLGATKTSTGFFQNRGKGIVHRLELWDNVALGEQDCIDLAWWPTEDAEFDVVSFGDYTDGNRNDTKIDFFAAQLT